MLYLALLVVPCVVLFLFSYSALTYAVATWTAGVLEPVLNRGALAVGQHEFIPFFGPVHYVVVESSLPTLGMILGTALVCLGVGVFFATGKRRGMPFSIFALFALTIQLISCVFFLIGAQEFPYDGADYSLLYMEQQVGIWLFFLIIAGCVTGLISYGRLVRKMATFAGIMAYSFLFGCVRYVVYLSIVTEFSSLFMAPLFFALGPFFDFLYLVFFYSVFVDRLNLTFGRRDEGDVWLWT